MATMHSFLRDQQGGLEDATKSVLYGPSTQNKIERWWKEWLERMEKFHSSKSHNCLPSLKMVVTTPAMIPTGTLYSVEINGIKVSKYVLHGKGTPCIWQPQFLQLLPRFRVFRSTHELMCTLGKSQINAVKRQKKDYSRPHFSDLSPIIPIPPSFLNPSL